jgi:protein ImuA
VHVITSIGGLLRTLSGAAAKLSGDASTEESRALFTGLTALDTLAPGGRFATGAVHEVLSGTDTPPFLLPALIAKTAAPFGRVVWCDSRRELHPPALAALGMPLDRLVILRPPAHSDELWAIAECLRCRGVSACIAPLGRLSRVQSRKLQLAAERGGGIALILRPAVAASWPYAAVTRWRVRPVPGERTVQRICVELIHGHGGRLGQSVLVEVDRETHHVRAIEAVAARPDLAQVIPESA